MDPLQQIHPSVWIAPGARLYGRISIGEGASVWTNVTMRAECHEIRIGRMTNVQDFVMVHVAYDRPTIVGDFCSITHHVTLHGCTVEDDCLIGIAATVMDGAVIGRGSIVAGGAFVKEHSVFPPGSIIAGMPAAAIKQRDCARPNRLNAWQYHRNASFYRERRYRAWDGPEYERWLAEITARVERDEDR